jgi:peroxiredoxin
MRSILFAMTTWFALFSNTLFGVSPFQLPWMNSGEEGIVQYKSESYLDAVWVVEAYFLGCPYCNDNAPNVNQLQTHFKNDERVQILDVGIDKNDSQYAEWIRRHKPNHPVLKDPGRTLIRQLGTTTYPSTYVLDKKMNVIYQWSGVWSSKVEQQIKDAVEKALGN